jgi:hypothetical protein
MTASVILVRAVLLNFVLAAVRCLSTQLPVIKFLSPEEGACLGTGADVSFDFELHNMLRGAVLFQLDGTLEHDVAACDRKTACRQHITVNDLTNGWHAATILALGTQENPQSRSVNAAATLSFFVGTTPDERPTSQFIGAQAPEQFPESTIESAEVLDSGNNSASPGLWAGVFTIQVICFDRPQSLRRTLDSLLAAEYSGETVDLEFHVDAVDLPAHATPVQHAKFTARRVRLHAVVQLVHDFVWPHGHKRVHRRTSNAGIRRQWLEAWYPDSACDAALFIEDDVEVHPLYYQWSRKALDAYASSAKQCAAGLMDVGSPQEPGGDGGAGDGAGRLAGVCLQRQWLVLQKFMHDLQPRNAEQPYLYQMIGSWGVILLGGWWHRFLQWYARRVASVVNSDAAVIANHTAGEREDELALGFKPWLPNSISNLWVEQAGAKHNPNGMMHVFMYEFMHVEPAYCLYPNLPRKWALAVSHREPGEHYSAQLGADAMLMPVHGGSLDKAVKLDAANADAAWWQDHRFFYMPPYRTLLALDFAGEEHDHTRHSDGAVDQCKQRQDLKSGARFVRGDSPAVDAPLGWRCNGRGVLEILAQLPALQGGRCTNEDLQAPLLGHVDSVWYQPMLRALEGLLHPRGVVLEWGAGMATSWVAHLREAMAVHPQHRFEPPVKTWVVLDPSRGISDACKWTLSRAGGAQSSPWLHCAHVAGLPTVSMGDAVSQAATAALTTPGTSSVSPVDLVVINARLSRRQFQQPGRTEKSVIDTPTLVRVLARHTSPTGSVLVHGISADELQRVLQASPGLQQIESFHPPGLPPPPAGSDATGALYVLRAHSAPLVAACSASVGAGTDACGGGKGPAPIAEREVFRSGGILHRTQLFAEYGVVADMRPAGS